MDRHNFAAALVAAAAIAMPLTSHGQPAVVTPPPATSSDATTGTDMPMTISPDRLIGLDVIGSEGDTVGEVGDLVMDPQSGQIQQMIVEFGGVLGIGERQVAIPWDEVEVDPSTQEVRIGMSEAQLRAAPTFEDDDNPFLYSEMERTGSGGTNPNRDRPALDTPATTGNSGATSAPTTR